MEREWRAGLALAVQQARFNKADPRKLPKPETLLKSGKTPRLSPEDRSSNLSAWAMVLRAQGKAVAARAKTG